MDNDVVLLVLTALETDEPLEGCLSPSSSVSASTVNEPIRSSTVALPMNVSESPERCWVWHFLASAEGARSCPHVPAVLPD